jgi:hypothetical protein
MQSSGRTFFWVLGRITVWPGGLFDPNSSWAILSHFKPRVYVADSAVTTLAIGKPGAANTALFAVEILALNDAALYERLAAWRAARALEVLELKLPE